MRCPYCGNPDTQVKDSRPSEDNTAIRRRRVCPDCGGRFTTFERVQLRELTVVKRSGRRVPFDRDKLMRSVQVALRKRAVDPERVERMVNGIVRQLESSGESEVTSEQIGQLVMEGLNGLDDGRLCALRLGLPQFPRGRGFRGRSRRAGRRAAGRRKAADGWRRAQQPAQSADRRVRPPHDGGGAPPRPAQSRPAPAQPGRRLRHRARRTAASRSSSAAAGPRSAAGPHAETEALARGRRGGRGATAYVTLEPCAHKGGTPPAPRRWSRPASRASSRAMDDPDPRVNGKGHALLEAAGIAVTTGVLAEEAARAHSGPHLADQPRAGRTSR